MRIKIYYDDKSIFESTIVSSRIPQSSKELLSDLKVVIDILQSKDIEDKEVLGKYSPELKNEL